MLQILDLLSLLAVKVINVSIKISIVGTFICLKDPMVVENGSLLKQLEDL